MPNENNTYSPVTPIHDELVGKIPSWIINRGNAIIFAVIIMIFTMGCFVPYSESINAPAIIYYRDNNTIIAVATAPSKGFGKVAVGQKVVLDIDAYPVQEYGFITGKVVAINPQLTNGCYAVTISIDSSTTSYGVHIAPLNKMTGHAKIVVDSKPIIYKFIPILYQFTQK